MFVQHVMTEHVITVSADVPAATAGEILLRSQISGLPVIDGQRAVLGVITERDLIHALRNGVDIFHAPVHAVMQAYPLYVREQTDLETAAELMDEWQVRRLPVCRDGQVIGVVSRGDVLGALMREATRPSLTTNA